MACDRPDSVRIHASLAQCPAATGVYNYHLPPQQPATQVFDGMARWSGTSFAAPMVAGLIVAEMARNQSSAMDAWQAVLGTAANTGGFGPVLLP